MKTVIVVGGSKEIGNAIVTNFLTNHNVVNISRKKPAIDHENLNHHPCDIVKDGLPNLTEADKLIYYPGSIVLKAISRLSLKDIRYDFVIKVLGAVKAIKKYLQPKEVADVAEFIPMNCGIVTLKF